MGLFDHLFKAKSPSGEEKVGEPAVEGSPAAKPAEGPLRSHPPQRADPSAFLHPKSFVPRGAPGLTPAPRPSSAISAKAAERRTAAGPPPAADEIVLTLGDVLSRIPTHYLKSGAHDSKRELRFKINDLSSDIARGRAAVPLSRIAQLVPEIFVKEISRDEDTEVRLPLQKLVEQIGLLRSQPKISVVEKLARPVTGGELPPVARPGAPMQARQSEPIVVQSVVEAIPSTAGESPVPPIVLAEPAGPQRAFELKPAAEQPAAPTVLGPPPVIETPAATVTPPAPVPPEPAPPPAILEPAPPISVLAPPIPEATPPVEPVASAAEPAPAMPSSPPATPPPIPDPQKVAIGWEGDLERKTGEESAVHLEPAAEGPKLAPLESPQLNPGEESIQLSLAAILRNCPPEILVGQLPHVDDSVRITLPFAPIDRQLVKGQVEVSALRFIAALPEVYQKYFVAKVGVKVPIPLEEVFQNLPTPTHQLTPVPPAPATVVLAPALSAAALATAAALAAEKEEEPSVLSVPSTPPAAAEPPPLPAMAASSAPEMPEIVPPEPVAPPSLPVTEPVVASASPPGGVHDAAPAMEPVESPAGLAAAPEASPAPAPTADLTPPPLPISPVTESASAASSEPPKVAFQPPVFRPHFLPPPPIFGFAPPPTAPEAEPAAKPEPPSALAGFTEAIAPPPTPIPESAPLEANAPATPVSEAVASPAEPVVAPVAEARAAEAPFVAPPAEMPVPASQPSEAEVSPEAGSEGELTADLIAFAGEHAAPDLVQFSSEPVPHADLAETLAHETTYAPDLAEVVHIPEAESSESKVPVTAEQPTAPVALEQPAAPVHEHHAVPIMEGLAAAAVAETIAEHAPLHFHDVAPVIEPVKSPDEVVTPVEVATPVEMPAAEKSAVDEPVVAAERVVAEETAPPVPAAERPAETPVAPAESTPEPERPAPASETPEAPASEPPAAAAVAPPPSLPLFPLPKLRPEPVHAELTRVEVLPPALPLRRFDQDAVQALFMTEEALDLPKISRLAATLPGVYACVIATRDQACTGGTLPEGFDLAALLGLAPRVGEAAGRMPIGQLKHFTLYGDAYSVSFFERNGLSICAVHRPRSFVPGVREKLVALADELSR